MTMMNPITLLNQGLEKSKSLASAEEAIPKLSFAQTLREQARQQGDLNTKVAEAHPRPALSPLKPTPQVNAQDSQAHQAPANPQNSAQASTDQTQANTAEADEKTAATAESEGVDERSAAATERKKKAFKANETPDMQVAMSPWMQTMMAMRPDLASASPTESASNPRLSKLTDLPTGLAAADEVVQTDALPLSEIMPIEPSSATTDGASTGGLSTLFAQSLASVNMEDGQPSAQASLNARTPSGLEALALHAAPQSMPPTALDALAMRLSPSDKALGSDGMDTNALTMQQLASAPPLATGISAMVAQSPVLTSQIAVPFGNERWQAAMNQHVMKMVGAGDEVASLTLSPPDLGPIQVVLKVDNQSVDTSFVTDNPAVRQALEDGMQDLRARMDTLGLSLGNTFIGNGQQAEQHFLAQGESSRVASTAAEDEASLENPLSLTASVRAPRGLVDIQV